MAQFPPPPHSSSTMAAVAPPAIWPFGDEIVARIAWRRLRFAHDSALIPRFENGPGRRSARVIDLARSLGVAEGQLLRIMRARPSKFEFIDDRTPYIVRAVGNY